VRDALASCEMTHVVPRALCVGVAGAGRDAERQELWQALSRRELATELVIHSDFSIALDDAFGDGPGVLLISAFTFAVVPLLSQTSQTPKPSFDVVSIKPSPSRQHLMPKMLEANMKIKSFLQQKKNTVFIDVYHKMLNEDGTPKDELFIEDKLHMNKKGYSIWQKSIKPYLLK